MKIFREDRIKSWGYPSKGLETVFRPERIRDLTELFCRGNGTFLARRLKEVMVMYSLISIGLISIQHS
jgi:hypothetical protein